MAGMKRYLQANPQLQNGVFVAILCGSNIPFDRLRFITERARWGSGEEALVGCIIPERPGAVFSFLKVMKGPWWVVELTSLSDFSVELTFIYL